MWLAGYWLYMPVFVGLSGRLFCLDLNCRCLFVSGLLFFVADCLSELAELD